MHNKTMTIIGAVALLIGVFLLSVSYDFTGFVVSDSGGAAGSFVAVVLVIVGLFLIIYSREK